MRSTRRWRQPPKRWLHPWVLDEIRRVVERAAAGETTVLDPDLGDADLLQQAVLREGRKLGVLVRTKRIEKPAKLLVRPPKNLPE
jgi:hypothetical protein